MPNIVDFLKEYGGATFESVPFTCVDNLVLSQLAYSDLSSAATPAQLPGVAALAKGPYPQDAGLLAALQAGLRYGPALLTDYVNQVDPDECKQFSAVTAILPDGTAYIAFRGTDNTIVGWKEDFNLAFSTPIPAQREAVRYLERAADRFPGMLRLGGHSKGGNLAIYAAALCSPQTRSRLLEVYSNDGPGHDASIIASPGYMAVSERIRTYLPQSSVIGMLLEHGDDYVIVRSNAPGIFQHLPYTWQVKGADFDRVDKRSWTSMRMDETIRDWLSKMTVEKRRRFTDALFSLFSAGEATTFADLLTDWKSVPAIVAELGRAGREDGLFLLGLFGELLEAAYQSCKRAAIGDVEDWRSSLTRIRTELTKAKGDWLSLLQSRFSIEADARNVIGGVKRIAAGGQALAAGIASAFGTNAGGATPPDAASRAIEGPAALYEVRGIVAHGKRIGGSIGYPTANLPLTADTNRPVNGVYVADMLVAGMPGRFYGVLNQGLHPTFPDGEPSVEMHILGARPELYGREIAIRYLCFLREERRFENAEELTAQIADDVRQALSWLGERGIDPAKMASPADCDIVR